MKKIQETTSNWQCVTEMMEGSSPLTLGRYASYWFYQTPRRMLHSLAYYKFAAKLIGPEKKVLDIGCNEGLGSYVLAKECGFCKGIDFDAEAISQAKKNFPDESLIQFSEENALEKKQQEPWDAIVNFDVIEHILPEHADLFLSQIASSLSPHGIAVIGTPSEISQQFASPISKKGHVNIYSHERLEIEMKKHFRFVFFFGAQDEIVHTGFLPLAHYFIVIGCSPK